MTSKATGSPSTSSLWLSSRNPDVIGLTSSIARALYLDIENFFQQLRDNNWIASPEKIPESEYFSYQDSSQSYNAVSIQEISEFIIYLNKEFKFSAECLILTAVYIKKFMLYSNIPLMSSNWKNILLMSTLVAQRISDNAFISASDYKNIEGFCLIDIQLMEIEYLNIISYSYRVEVMDYLSQINYLQDIAKSMENNSLHLNCEKLESIVKRSEWLCEEESDNDCGIYHSEAMCSIDMGEIDW